MRASRLNIVTLREDPSDAEIASHRLLTRAGFLHKSGAGLYLYAPLLKRVVDKVADIVAEEIAAAGGLEVTMPIMQEQALWEKSGRWAAYQASRTMLTVRDRNDQVFGLAPTAEEVVTDYAAGVLKSYKQLPVTFFQQHTKFRDEIRPRFGLMRVKEFIMMDAYSFHVSDASLDESYQAMRQAYGRAFRRMGLEAFAVEADSGAIGGSGSHEFMVAADVGEDAILFCQESGYAANVERALGRISAAPTWSAPAAATEVATPGVGAIDDVVGYLKANGYADLTAANTLKAVLYVARLADESSVEVVAFIRGDREVNEVKLTNAVSRRSKGVAVLNLRPMQADEVRRIGSEPGFVGPVSPLKAALFIVDRAVDREAPLVVGANRADAHVVGFRLKDSAVALVREDILKARAGDACPESGKPLAEKRGIEVGHVFKLGTKYSAAMKAEFTGQDGKLHPFVMGCYGIGTSRVVAAAVEQHHDADGITWPLAIAPYHAVVVPVGKPGDAAVDQAAESIYRELLAQGIETILDDRDAKPGVKFKDWDLIGIPFRVVVGRGVAEGLVELKPRTKPAENVPIAEAAARVGLMARDELSGGQRVVAAR
ncbi:MAG TPA: proline--tRNA ligase [Planctomycetota bacterium]|nr:proline--tRNA ligase [Planctomycetota bacterium]